MIVKKRSCSPLLLMSMFYLLFLYLGLFLSAKGEATVHFTHVPFLPTQHLSPPYFSSRQIFHRSLSLALPLSLAHKRPAQQAMK